MNALFVVTTMTIEKLTDPELASLGLCMLLQNDPRDLYGWDKMEPLFVARDTEGVPVMHELSKKVFFQIYNKRFNI